MKKITINKPNMIDIEQVDIYNAVIAYQPEGSQVIRVLADLSAGASGFITITHPLHAQRSLPMWIYNDPRMSVKRAINAGNEVLTFDTIQECVEHFSED